MSFLSNIFTSVAAILKAWLGSKSSTPADVAKAASTVVAKINGDSITFAELSSFLHIAKNLDLATIEGVVTAKTPDEQMSDALLTAGEIVALGGALRIIPGAGAISLAITAFEWILAHQPLDIVYPTPMGGGKQGPRRDAI